jgi:hypothetical protein
MSDEHISEDEFWEKWGVILKADGVMFEHEDVKDHPLEHVWTIVDTGAYEDENWYAMPGFHIVNKLGYIMTKRAWTADTPDAIYYLHEDEDDGERKIFLYPVPRCLERQGWRHAASSWRNPRRRRRHDSRLL